MGIQKNLKMKSGLKLIGFAIIAQGLVACGGDGVFSSKRSFANKNLDAIEIMESDENAMGLDSGDIESGEEITSILNEGESYDQEANNNVAPDSTENAAGVEDGEEAGENEYPDGYEANEGAGEDEYAENCPGKSNCNGNGNGKKYVGGDEGAENGGQYDNPGQAKKAGGNYICILDGPGKSIRLGLVDETPAGQTGTPDVICMTQSACLSEVSKVFDVKMAHRRGFCPNKNKHVIQMSDEEVVMMVEKLMN